MEAKGHTAAIFRDGDAVMVPLSEDETRRLHGAAKQMYDRLKKTGDFPEKREWDNMLSNLTTAMFLHDRIRQGL